MIRITDTFYGSSFFTLSGRFPDSQFTESFHKIKTDTTSMLQQFMNVVSEIFPVTLWQPDSAFSHIYANDILQSRFFFLYTVAATVQAFHLIPSHITIHKNLHMINVHLTAYSITLIQFLAHCFYNYNHIRDTSEFFLLHKPDTNPKKIPYIQLL